MPTTLVTIALLGGFVVLIGVIVTRRVIRHRKRAKPVDPEVDVERCRSAGIRWINSSCSVAPSAAGSAASTPPQKNSD